MGKTEDWDRHRGEAPVHHNWGWPLPKVQRRKGTTQTLLLPTRSLKSRGKAKDINKWYRRWRDVSSGSDFPNLKAFLVFLHSKLSLSGRKEALYLHLKADFYLWPKVSLSTFNVKKNPYKKNELSKHEERHCALGLLPRVDIRLIVFKDGAMMTAITCPRRSVTSHFTSTWGWSLDFHCSNCPPWSHSVDEVIEHLLCITTLHFSHFTTSSTTQTCA